MTNLNGLSADDVRYGYRQVLGREPESDAVIASSIATYGDVQEFWRALLSSAEFSGIKDPSNQAHQDLFDAINHAYWAPVRHIDYDVSSDTMNILVDRIRDQWTLLGENDPHWSVLTHEDYRSANLDAEALAGFHASGHSQAAVIEKFEQRTGVKLRRGACLELGCGVGRITRFLADDFESVIAVDISPGNLRLCSSYMEEQGIKNVSTVAITSIEDIEALPEFDFFFSVIVLQHNSPPIQKALLTSLLSKIRPGGGCLFQIPTDTIGYRFDVTEYLASGEASMEMHTLPKPVVLKIIRDAGLDILDVIPDGQTGIYGSNTFFAVKP